MPYKDPLKKKENARRWAAQNRERLKYFQHKHYLQNREKVLTKTSEYYQKNKEKIRSRTQAYNIKAKYNITLEQFENILHKQNGKCTICRSILRIKGSNGQDKFQIDHDHKCCPSSKTCGNCIRSILCSRCNLVIGLMEDNPEILQNAANYLEGRLT